LVRHHHERYDGTGYPDGLKGDDIPLGSRIISVCDSFEAMTEERPYRRALAQETAVSELIGGSGTQFDPVVIQAFLKLLQQGAFDRMSADAVQPPRKVEEGAPTAGVETPASAEALGAQRAT
jgi:HD-GYP domain-containing protein (c-di-GMP phosphodiesterase class II)